jgi:hypothetical protein
MYDIDIINKSSVVTDAQVNEAVTALQIQVSDHFAPHYGADAHLSFVPSGKVPSPAHFWIAVLDNSDVAGALGYHDITTQGLPLGKVFAQTSALDGTSWTVDLSHELLEMCGDPDINLTALIDSSASQYYGKFVAYEVGDPCEDDSFGYKIGNVLVSDFVFPSYFEGFRTSGPFDYTGNIRKPFDILPNGYLSIFDPVVGGWTQATIGARNYRARPRVGSRRERRTIKRGEWIRSTVR